MFYPQKEIPLKDGRTAVLRAPDPARDAAETVDFLQQACGETEFLARYPEERAFKPEAEVGYLQSVLDSPLQMMIVCTVDGKIAGNCQIVFMNTEKTRHRAAVMIGLLREYWNLGIGSAMFAEMIEAARAHGGIRQLELEMIEGNDRAAALYRKMGFSVMAEIPDAFRFRDGSSHKAIYMRRLL